MTAWRAASPAAATLRGVPAGMALRYSHEDDPPADHRQQPATNADLWRELLDLTDRHQVTFIWVKGHVENAENCRCDELAVLARQAEDLAPDEG